MVGKREAKREELTRRILSAASARIARDGLGGLRTRDIAEDADCGLGTIYKCYADLDALIMHVNFGTIGQLDDVLRDAVDGLDDPGEMLQALAASYFEFASEHRMLWLAVFDHQFPDSSPLAEQRIAELERLFGHIVLPLMRLAPELSDAKAEIRARSIFAAVHGMVSLNLERRVISSEDDVLRAELRNFVDLLVAGIRSIGGED